MEVSDSAWEDRLVVLAGDISVPCFGVAAGTYATWARQVTTIIHAAAAVQFLDARSGYAVLRAANVASCGPIAALALAAGAHLHYVSTSTVADAFEGESADTLRDDGGGFATADAYTLSKFAAEQCFMRLASSTRLSVSMSRPGLLTWCAGGCVNADDWVNRLCATCVLMGAVPDTPPSSSAAVSAEGVASSGDGWGAPFPYTPVDAAAARIVSAALAYTDEHCGGSGVLDVPVTSGAEVVRPSDVLRRLAFLGGLRMVTAPVWVTALAADSALPFWPLLGMLDQTSGKLITKAAKSSDESKAAGLAQSLAQEVQPAEASRRECGCTRLSRIGHAHEPWEQGLNAAASRLLVSGYKD
jgi:hypothetical protein